MNHFTTAPSIPNLCLYPLDVIRQVRARESRNVSRRYQFVKLFWVNGRSMVCFDFSEWWLSTKSVRGHVSVWLYLIKRKAHKRTYRSHCCLVPRVSHRKYHKIMHQRTASIRRSPDPSQATFPRKAFVPKKLPFFSNIFFVLNLQHPH